MGTSKGIPHVLPPWIDLSPRPTQASAAPPVVFLHNGFDSARTWSGVVRELAQGTSHPRLLAWDRYGAGDWPWPAGGLLPVPADIVAHGCEELRSCLDAAGIDRCLLVGHCLGGAVATRFAALHGPRCVGLHLTATGLYSTPRLRDRAGWLRASWDELPSATQEHLALMHGAYRAPRLWHLLVNHANGYIMDPEYDLRPLLVEVRCPVRYLLGERDAYFERQHAQSALAALTAASESRVSLVTWPEVGHDLHRERTAAFAADVRWFAAETCAGTEREVRGQ